MIIASAVCMTLAYPGYEQYHYGGGHHELSAGHGGGYDDGEADYGHHHASARIGESHGHEYEHHHEDHHEDEHVDYYVSVANSFVLFYIENI